MRIEINPDSLPPDSEGNKGLWIVIILGIGVVIACLAAGGLNAGQAVVAFAWLL